MHIRPANWWFRDIEHWECHRLRRVVIRTQVASAVELALELALEYAVCVGGVEVYLFLCVSSMSADCLLCHYGKGGILVCGFDETSPGVFLSQPSRFICRKINSTLLLCSDLGTMFLDEILCFLYCSTWKPFFGYCGHVQGQAHVGLFQLNTTSLPCYRSRHVEHLQDISCCFKHWEATITSTIYAAVASSKVIKTCFVPSRGCLSGDLSAKFPDLAASWCSISWTVWTNASVNHRGFPLWAAIDWSRSSCHTPAVWYTVNWRPLTTVWIYSHPTACCFLSVLLPVLWTILHWASWVIFLVASLAASRCINWCLRSCCVPISDVLEEVPANQLDLDPLGPGWGGCVSVICWCGLGEEDDNEKKWVVLRII